LHNYTFEICKQKYNKTRRKKNKVINRKESATPLLIGVSADLTDLTGLFSRCFLWFLGVGFCGRFSWLSAWFWAVSVLFVGVLVCGLFFVGILLVFSGLMVWFSATFCSVGRLAVSCSRRWRDIFCPLFCPALRDYVFGF
jgi:hypothetical protein